MGTPSGVGPVNPGDHVSCTLEEMTSGKTLAEGRRVPLQTLTNVVTRYINVYKMRSIQVDFLAMSLLTVSCYIHLVLQPHHVQ